MNRIGKGYGWSGEGWGVRFWGYRCWRNFGTRADLAPYLRRVLRRVHPDRFAQFPRAAGVNEESIKALHDLLENYMWVQSEDGSLSTRVERAASMRPSKLEFYAFRSEIEGSRGRRPSVDWLDAGNGLLRAEVSFHHSIDGVSRGLHRLLQLLHLDPIPSGGSRKVARDTNQTLIDFLRSISNKARDDARKLISRASSGSGIHNHHQETSVLMITIKRLHGIEVNLSKHIAPRHAGLLLRRLLGVLQELVPKLSGLPSRNWEGLCIAIESSSSVVFPCPNQSHDMVPTILLGAFANDEAWSQGLSHSKVFSACERYRNLRNSISNLKW
uniref:DUF4460 domain-containing protein n=1 Tax=Compsopogon caeruleus TaxID=31354 RepID=A0A7S1T7A3_9RHOD|mmetsp:Transcript_1207/g.2536  ORF Transcript_1207/g.2536 Transcript_1207/m.2536 type:complete len:328 (+) Transcript_1207:176-1159(+)